MEFNIRPAYAVVAAFIVAHILYRSIQRRIYARNLPPKFWTFEPFFNFDWTLLTSLDAWRYVNYQSHLGHTYRLSTTFTPVSAVVSCHPDNVQAIAGGKDWGVGWRLSSMKGMMGVGLITTDGEEWTRTRKIMKPAFNRGNIDGLEVVGQVADEVLEKIENEGGEVDVQPLLTDAVGLS
jgi:cytochrome P450